MIWLKDAVATTSLFQSFFPQMLDAVNYVLDPNYHFILGLLTFILSSTPEDNKRGDLPLEAT